MSGLLLRYPPFSIAVARDQRLSAPRIRGMNTTKFVIAFLVCALSCAVTQAAEKSVAQKTEEVWDKTKAKTKQVTRTVAKKTKETAKTVAKETKQAAKTVARKTKETVNAIEHKIDTPDADARRVNVTVNDGGVRMPRSLSAGKTAFVVTNNGNQSHNFEIEGEDLEKSFWFSLAPRQTKTMQVNLKPGSYEADCSVAEHADKEAKVRLVVK